MQSVHTIKVMLLNYLNTFVSVGKKPLLQTSNIPFNSVAALGSPFCHCWGVRLMALSLGEPRTSSQWFWAPGCAQYRLVPGDQQASIWRPSDLLGLLWARACLWEMEYCLLNILTSIGTVWTLILVNDVAASSSSVIRVHNVLCPQLYLELPDFKTFSNLWMCNDK